MVNMNTFIVNFIGNLKRRKSGMELVQVAILIAIAVALGIIFRTQLTKFVNDVFKDLFKSGF